MHLFIFMKLLSFNFLGWIVGMLFLLIARRVGGVGYFRLVRSIRTQNKTCLLLFLLILRYVFHNTKLLLYIQPQLRSKYFVGFIFFKLRNNGIFLCKYIIYLSNISKFDTKRYYFSKILKFYLILITSFMPLLTGQVLENYSDYNTPPSPSPLQLFPKFLQIMKKGG